MPVQALGYAGFGSAALDDWRQFGTGLVGLQASPGVPDTLQRRVCIGMEPTDDLMTALLAAGLTLFLALPLTGFAARRRGSGSTQPHAGSS